MVGVNRESLEVQVRTQRLHGLYDGKTFFFVVD